MRRVVTIFALAVLACIADSVNADLCPIYLYGQWNGIYYYYCKDEGMCMADPTPGPGQSATPKQCGCVGQDCLDPNPIRPLVVDPKKQADPKAALKTAKRQKKHMKPKKMGGKPGESDDDEFTFFITHHKTIHTGASDTEVLEVEAKGGKRYFRTLDLKVDDIIGDVLIGQELEKKPDSGTIKAATIDKSEDKFNHDLKTTAGKIYKVMSEDEMEKP